MVKSSDVEMEENKENEGKAESKVISQNTTSTPDSEQDIHQQSSEKSNGDEETDHGINKSNPKIFLFQFVPN